MTFLTSHQRPGAEPEPCLEAQPGGVGEEVSVAPVRRRRRLRKRWWIPGCLLALSLVWLVVSFLSFAERVSQMRPPADPRADAIVVLTGGQARIESAVALLSEQRARRLLISGVNPGTTDKQIIARTTTPQDLFACCVDLDRKALNTIGNASEAALWAKEHGFTSLVLVTSAYHLPRASMELNAAMPDLRLVAYPVVAEELQLDDWYLRPRTIRLLLREFVKYTVARVRVSTIGLPDGE
ncbi:YdcF family protein [Microvirga tunisiensis]|uniref:YdcF family protein n=1 Tax=Pannonibacter tanglangensis TaxID=2750084 RepID=A0A7X5F5Q6_9HYPH|nr:YdcF family protein [Pannonibacter sp. XCT-53]